MDGTYKPPQTAIVAQVRTAAGRVRATFHIPKGYNFTDHLTKIAFWNLTNVMLPGAERELPFFALRSAAALVVVPEGSEPELQATALHDSATSHRLSCLLPPLGTITGDIDLLPGVRVSDYVLHHPGFLNLRDAEIAGEEGKLAFAMVNAAALMGVSEPSNMADEKAEAPLAMPSQQQSPR